MLRVFHVCAFAPSPSTPQLRCVISRNGALEDKAQTLAGLGKNKVAVAVTTDMETRVDGDHAMVTGIYHTTGTDEAGKAFDRRLRYIDTFAKRDGRWQIVSSQGTPITP